jgi:hypothetical protein
MRSGVVNEANSDRVGFGRHMHAVRCDGRTVGSSAGTTFSEGCIALGSWCRGWHRVPASRSGECSWSLHSISETRPQEVVSCLQIDCGHEGRCCLAGVDVGDQTQVSWREPDPVAEEPQRFAFVRTENGIVKVRK